MRASIFTLDNSDTILTDTSISIRVGCLLADLVVIPDDLSAFINMHEFIGFVPLNYKLTMLIGAYSKNPDHEEMTEKLKEIKKKMHQFNTLKYKDTNLIVAYKKMERHIHTLFDDYKIWMIANMRKNGFSQLSPMLKEKIITTFIMVTEDTGDDNETNKESRSVRDLLNDFPGEEKQPGIFIMPNEFLCRGIRNQERYFEAYESEACDISLGYLHQCFIMPDLNFFQGLELISIRKELREYGNDFRKKMDEWLMLCYETEDAAQRLNFFREEVFSAAKVMEKVIIENRLMQYGNISKNKKMSATYVFIGEVPLRHVRHFLKNYNGKADSSWKELKDTEENDPRLDKRIPLMVTSNILPLDDLEKNDNCCDDETPDNMSTKKFISID